MEEGEHGRCCEEDGAEEGGWEGVEEVYALLCCYGGSGREAGEGAECGFGRSAAELSLWRVVDGGGELLGVERECEREGGR